MLNAYLLNRIKPALFEGNVLDVNAGMSPWVHYFSNSDNSNFKSSKISFNIYFDKFLKTKIFYHHFFLIRPTCSLKFKLFLDMANISFKTYYNAIVFIKLLFSLQYFLFTNILLSFKALLDLHEHFFKHILRFEMWSFKNFNNSWNYI